MIVDDLTFPPLISPKSLLCNTHEYHSYHKLSLIIGWVRCTLDKIESSVEDARECPDICCVGCPCACLLAEFIIEMIGVNHCSIIWSGLLGMGLGSLSHCCFHIILLSLMCYLLTQNSSLGCLNTLLLLVTLFLLELLFTTSHLPPSRLIWGGGGGGGVLGHGGGDYPGR